MSEHALLLDLVWERTRAFFQSRGAVARRITRRPRWLQRYSQIGLNAGALGYTLEALEHALSNTAPLYGMHEAQVWIEHLASFSYMYVHIFLPFPPAWREAPRPGWLPLGGAEID